MRNEMTNVTIDEHYIAMTEERHAKIQNTAKELARAISINDLMRSDFELVRENIDALDEFLREVKDFAENLNPYIGFYGHYFDAVRFSVKMGIRNVYDINCRHTPYQAGIFIHQDISYVGTDWRSADSRYTHLDDYSYIIENPSHINLFMSMIYGQNTEDHLVTSRQNGTGRALGLMLGDSGESFGWIIDPDILVSDSDTYVNHSKEEIEMFVNELYENFDYLAFDENFFDQEEFKIRPLSKKFEFLSEDGTTIFLKRIEQERKIVVS